MLDLAKLWPQIMTMGEDYRGRLNRQEAREKAAHRVYCALASDQGSLLRAKEARTSWLVAIPLEPLNRVLASSSAPATHWVAATDGSQLAPDRHQGILCYLINTGRVFIPYGFSLPRLESQPNLYFQEEDIYWEREGSRSLVEGEIIGARRTLEEAISLEDLMQDGAETAQPGVALTDGSLIRWEWSLEGKKLPYKQEYLQRYLKFLARARELNISVAGYISVPGSTDVVNLLRVGLCNAFPGAPVDCDRCPGKGSGKPLACQAIEGLTDAQVFWSRLTPGQRSPLFRSQSQVLEEYGDHRVVFFYLRVAEEVVRVEIPLWVAKDKTLLDRVHAVIYDQVGKGQGYPIALQEAHHLAVIRGKDGELFYQSLNRVLAQQGALVPASPKQQSKRRGLI